MREKIKTFFYLSSLQSVALQLSCATSAAWLGLIAEQAEEGTSISAVANRGHCRRKGHFFCFICFSSLMKENEDVSTEGRYFFAKNAMQKQNIIQLKLVFRSKASSFREEKQLFRVITNYFEKSVLL